MVLAALPPDSPSPYAPSPQFCFPELAACGTPTRRPRFTLGGNTVILSRFQAPASNVFPGPIHRRDSGTSAARPPSTSAAQLPFFSARAALTSGGSDLMLLMTAAAFHTFSSESHIPFAHIPV